MTTELSNDSYDRLYSHFLSHTNGRGRNKTATCFICEGEDKFSFDVVTGEGQCLSASCGVTCNHISFLTKFHQAWLDCTTDEHYRSLSEARKLPTSVFQNAKFAYDSYEDRWLVPYKNPFTPHLCNLGNFKTTGKNAFRIYNAPNVNDSLPVHFYCPYQKMKNAKTKHLIVCEGEWDALALIASLEARQRSPEKSLGYFGGKEFPCVIAAPGALNFPIHDRSWFKEFDRITLAYDNDDAGVMGKQKACSILLTWNKPFDHIEWEKIGVDTDGYDVRDNYINYKTDSLSHLESAITDYACPQTEPEELSDGYVASINDIEFVQEFDEYITKYQKCGMHLTDDNLDAIAITNAIASSQYLHGEPLWFFMVSPPSAGKTTLIESFGGRNEYFDYASRITSKSLVSGWNSGEDASLINRMNGKTFFIKDFTVVLGMDRSAQKEVFNLLRDIYDGTLHITFGNGKVCNYHNLRFNLVAGVTDVIKGQSEASMGERFLRFDYSGAEIDDIPIIESALSNFGRTSERKTLLTEATLGYQKTLHSPECRWNVEELPRIGQRSKEVLTSLARYTGFIRTRSETDRTEGLIYRPRREVSVRLALQFAKLSFALEKVFNPRLKPKTYKDGSQEIEFGDRTLRLISKIAHDSSEGFNQEIVRMLVRNPDINRKTIERKLRVSSTTVQRRMEDMEQTKTVQYINRTSEAIDKKTGRPPQYYRVHDSFLSTVQHFEKFYTSNAKVL